MSALRTALENLLAAINYVPLIDREDDDDGPFEVPVVSSPEPIERAREALAATPAAWPSPELDEALREARKQLLDTPALRVEIAHAVLSTVEAAFVVAGSKQKGPVSIPAVMAEVRTVIDRGLEVQEGVDRSILAALQRSGEPVKEPPDFEEWLETEAGFDTLMLAARKLIERNYPQGPLFNDRNSPDPGPRLVAALADNIAALTPIPNRHDRKRMRLRESSERSGDAPK